MNREEYDKFRILLNIFDGKRQSENGGYPGYPGVITDVDLARHFEGQIALGFCVDTSSLNTQRITARFAAIDIDQLFAERLPIFEEAFAALKLERRCFITGGSAPTKGKIILPLIDGIARDRVADFLLWILKTAHGISPRLIPDSPRNGDLELYPRIPRHETDSAGVVRIGGRNIARGGDLESFAMLDGSPIDFSAIESCSRNRVVCTVRKLRGPAELPHPVRIREATNKGYSWDKFTTGVRGIFCQLMSFAYYCRRRYKAGEDALSNYRAIIEAIVRVSPDLDNPSPKYKDQRNPLKRELEELNAWGCVQREAIWNPKVASKRIPGAKRVYEALCYLVACRELDPHCFAATYENVADFTGLSKRAVQKASRTAVKHGLVVLLHPGRSRGKKRRGLSAMYGLIGAGETRTHVWQCACRSKRLQERFREAPVVGCSDPFALEPPTLEFWDLVRMNVRQVQASKAWALREAERIVVDKSKAEAGFKNAVGV